MSLTHPKYSPSTSSSLVSRLLLVAILSSGCAGTTDNSQADATIDHGVSITHPDATAVDAIVIGGHADAQDAVASDGASSMLRIEAFPAATVTAPGRPVAILAHVMDGDRVVMGQHLSLRMDSGDGTIKDRDAITMREICVATQDNNVATVEDRVVLPANGTSLIGRALRAPEAIPCPTGYSSSGWYMSLYTPPAEVAASQRKVMTVTANTATQTLSAEASLTVARDSYSNLGAVSLLTHTTHVHANDLVPVVVFARDTQGLPLSCRGDSRDNGNGDMPEVSGCSSINNPGLAPLMPTININNNAPIASTVGSVGLNLAANENMWVYSRGAGTMGTNEPRALTCLGGGAYVMLAQAKDRMATGLVVLRAQDRRSQSIAVTPTEITITR